MQNSELKKEILGPHKEVSAAELKKQVFGNPNARETRSIEMSIHSNEFSSEAQEGLKTYGSEAGLIEIEKTYRSARYNHTLLYITASIITVIISIGAFRYFSQTNQKDSISQVKNSQISIPKTLPQSEEKTTTLVSEKAKLTPTKTVSFQQKEKTPESTEASSISDLEAATVLFSVEIEEEIFNLSPLQKKEGELFRTTEIAKLKTKSARLRHYRNFKLVDQSIGIDQTLLSPILDGTPAFKETIVINPKYPDWVPADSVYVCSVNEALDWLIDEDYTKAQMRLKRLLTNTPEDLTAAFYLGYTLYLNEEYAQALTYLQMAQMHMIQTFDHDARFIEIKCYLQLGRDEDALKEALYLKNAGSFYAERAMELLE